MITDEPSGQGRPTHSVPIDPQKRFQALKDESFSTIINFVEFLERAHAKELDISALKHTLLVINALLIEQKNIVHENLKIVWRDPNTFSRAKTVNILGNLQAHIALSEWVVERAIDFANKEKPKAL